MNRSARIADRDSEDLVSNRIPAPTDTKDVIVIEHAPWLRRAKGLEDASADTEPVRAMGHTLANPRAELLAEARRPG